MAKNWFSGLQTIGIVGGLLFTAAAFLREAKSRRIANLMEITRNHREIWSELYRRPELARVSHLMMNRKDSTHSVEEDLFVRLLILHLNTVYHAMKDGLAGTPEGIREDINRFFAQPVVKSIWDRVKPFQDSAFVDFIEKCL